MERERERGMERDGERERVRECVCVRGYFASVPSGICALQRG